VIHTAASSTILLASLCVSGAGLAQTCRYEFDPKRVPQGEVFHYLKSNMDGAHPTNVSVYVARTDRIESLKWDADAEVATLVIADLDWRRYSVRRFESWRLTRGGERKLQATLAAGDDGFVRLSMLDKPVQLTHWPWHSYDFDFMSLNFVTAHLPYGQANCTFWRTDFIYSDPPSFGEIGEIRMRLEGGEMRHGVRTHRYSLSGPGLEDAAGEWWTDVESGLLLEFRMPIGDEPGYKNVLMRLRKRASMTADEWDRFKRGDRGADALVARARGPLSVEARRQGRPSH
jgi:hypothetical protein